MKRALLALATLLLLGVTVACAGDAAPAADPTANAPVSQAVDSPTEAPAPTPEPAAVRLVVLPFMAFAPFYLAQEEGYYAEQNLQVEFVEMTQQRDILPALVSGDVDVVSGLVSAGIFNTVAGDENVKIVADKGYVDPDGCDNFAFIAGRAILADVGEIDSAEQMRGRTLNVVRGTWLEYFSDRNLAPLGLAVSDFELTAIPSPSQPDALDQGSLAFATQNEPWVTIMANAGHRAILTPVTELMPQSQAAVNLYGARMMGDNADVGVRFMIAYLKGVQAYNQGKTDRNIAVLSEQVGLDPDLLREMCWPTLRVDGSVDIASMIDFQEWAVGAGLMDTVVPAERFWDATYIDAANVALGNR